MSSSEADGECARPVEFPEGNPIPQGSLVQFMNLCRETLKLGTRLQD